MKVACYTCIVAVGFTNSCIDVVHIMSVSKIAVEKGINNILILILTKPKRRKEHMRDHPHT